MANSKELQQFETSLMARLTGTALDKSSLRKVSADIMTMKKNGIMIDHVVSGKLPVDGVLINGKIDPNLLRKFFDLKINFKRFEVFPVGIIAPDGFRFTVTL